MKTIGVLGGMGPEATVLFMQRCINAVEARDDADHIPLLVDQNPQVPSRISAILEGKGQDPGPVLAAMAERLQAAGAQALVMPCNTAHYFVPQIKAAVDVPFLSMVQLAADHAARLAPGGTVGLLGSPALVRVGVFDAPLSDLGLRAVPPIDSEGVLAVIRAIKSGRAGKAEADALSEEAARMAQAGAEAICVCCTEFSLIASQIRAPIPIFDALDLLVDATVQASRDIS